MKLYQIIKQHEDDNIWFEYQVLKPYLKSLAIYFASQASKFENINSMVLVVFSITNNSCYCRIACLEEFNELLNSVSVEEAELINFNSKLIKDLI
jgi:hypothetical protein